LLIVSRHGYIGRQQILADKLVALCFDPVLKILDCLEAVRLDVVVFGFSEIGNLFKVLLEQCQVFESLHSILNLFLFLLSNQISCALLPSICATDGIFEDLALHLLLDVGFVGRDED